MAAARTVSRLQSTSPWSCWRTTKGCTRCALLVNVGRALVVQQDAMLAALRSGQLGGAALDVFEEEPLPADSPLWQITNVFISPHCCDATPQSHQRGLALFLDNLDRFLKRE